MATTAKAPTVDNAIRLRDGRRLSYTESGAPDGVPVIFMHGTPGSRLLSAIFHDEALSCNVRLICPDRPGYGNSTFRRGSLVEYVNDLVELADALALDRFAVVGTSGGGPFALACAATIPERLSGVAVVSGVGPLDEADSLSLIGGSDQSLIKLARRAPWALAPVVSVAVIVAKPFADRMMASMMKALPTADRASLEDPSLRAALKAHTLEAFRHGVRGLAWDELLFSRPWGFRLEDIKIPILLWQGEEDPTVLPEMGRRQAAAIPNCTATFVAGAGHYLIAAHMTEILSALTAKQ
jgi:pimeloyl-ACP methyl ester carboxylesterase